jgi:hypothetical protein
MIFRDRHAHHDCPAVSSYIVQSKARSATCRGEAAFYNSKKGARPIDDKRYGELVDMIDQLPIEQRVDLYYRLGHEIETTDYVDDISFHAREVG